MVNIIAIINQKGGVGKTTTAVNLSACLANLGKSVLLIDLDPQSNATTNLLPDDIVMDFTIKDVFRAQGSVSLDMASVPSIVEKLDIVPSNLGFAAIESELLTKIGRESRLKKAIRPQIKHMYDYIILDAPPSLGLISINALTAADEILIPIHEFFALEGVEQLINVSKQIQEDLNPDLTIGAVLLTMYDPRTNLAKDVKQRIIDKFGSLLLNTTIPRNIKLAEAPSYKESIFTYAPESSGAKAYKALTEELLKRWEQ